MKLFHFNFFSLHNRHDHNHGSRNHPRPRQPIGPGKTIAPKTCLAWGGVFLWMALIFYLSHQPATESSELSYGVLTMVLGWLHRISPFLAQELEQLQLHHLLRKNAHFLAYLVLALLTMNALAQSKVLGKQQVLWAFLICLLFAITDEIHQLFIPGRSGEVKDVVLDSVGAAAGILLYRFLATIIKFTSINKSLGQP